MKNPIFPNQISFGMIRIIDSIVVENLNSSKMGSIFWNQKLVPFSNENYYATIDAEIDADDVIIFCRENDKKVCSINRSCLQEVLDSDVSIQQVSEFGYLMPIGNIYKMFETKECNCENVMVALKMVASGNHAIYIDHQPFPKISEKFLDQEVVMIDLGDSLLPNYRVFTLGGMYVEVATTYPLQNF